MEITKEFLDRVKFLCGEIRKEEWSGILFYEQEGSIKDPENMIIRPKEILLMDVGNSVHTEYKFTGEVSSFIMDNNLMLCKYGHIHSHNTMGVFFSPEDDGELNRNCDTHNYYLSLIVNNYMDMIAKVVFAATPATFACPDEDGEVYSLSVQGLKKLMFIYDCQIVMPESISVTDDFRTRLAVVQKRTEEAKKRAAAEAAKKAKQNPPVQVQGLAGQAPINRSGIPNSTPPSSPNGTTANMKALPGGKTKEEWGETPDTSSNPYEDFICYLLRRGSEVKADTIDKAMLTADDDYNSGTVDVVESIMDNYTTYYDNYYCVDEKGLDTKHFLDVIEEVIAELEMSEGFTWTDKLAGELRLLGNRAEEAFEQLKTKEKQD